MNDITFNPGAIQDTVDVRDFQFGEEIGHASVPFDWNTGFDIENVLGFKLKIKDQGTSSSCGGQAWSYAGHVWDKIIDSENDEKSAFFIYAQTFVQGGGSAGRPNCDVVISQGWGSEVAAPSYINGIPRTESQYQRPQDITPEAKTGAAKDKAFAYANVSLDSDTIAQAIRDNNGCIMGIHGVNNGTWRSTYPLPPTTLSGAWSHWVYFGKAKLMNGKKYFGFANSWGTSVGDNGWQWISEDYINARPGGYPAIWSVWTIVAKSDPVVVALEHHFAHFLKQGDRNNEVQILQKALQIDGCFPSNVDTTTYFGTITANAVKKFQMKYGLNIDGKVGSRTNAKLNSLFDR